jgi:hypothetical protein
MRQQPLVRAKLLVLAGVQAQEMGLEQISALCRHRILAQNPRHLVRRWPTIEEALGTEPFQTHLKQLRRRYSREKIEHMIDSLGIEMGKEREAYFSDSEYAAALMNTRIEAIDQILAEDPRPKLDASHADQSRTAAGAKTPAPQVALMVWTPFVGGLLLLAALAILTRHVTS